MHGEHHESQESQHVELRSKGRVGGRRTVREGQDRKGSGKRWSDRGWDREEKEVERKVRIVEEGS